VKKKVVILSSIIVIVDQLTKYLVISNLNINESVIVIRNFLYMTYVQNEGAGWGFFYGSRWFLIFLSMVVLYAVIRYILLDINITKLEVVGYGLLMGGIVGNLVDRLVHGYVIDFIDTYIFGYNYPVFNVADMGIVTGVIIIAWTLFRSAKR
jgi:signal peptidase II